MDVKPGVNPGLALLASLFALIVALLACPASAEPVRFQIPAGPAATTLQSFAAQSNLNVLFQSDEVSTQETQAVSGSFEPLEALRRMLSRSGLKYQVQEPEGVLVSAEGRDTPSYGDSCGRPPVEPCRAPQSEHRESAATVTVTGTAVPAALDPGHVAMVDHYVTLTRQDFVAGGFQTVGDVLRSLPQNFGGGLNVGVIFAGGSQNITSQSAASTVNLRGLGSDSTLVLVNGQRLAASEGSGATDVSLIPLAAIERIEITTGSASAQYGSDAVAGVVNIIIRTDFQGVELSSALGTATEGGDFLQHYSVVAGHVFSDTSVFATADCSWQREIDAQQRDYIPVALAGTTLMPGMQNCSTIFNATGSFPGDLEAGVLGAYTKRFAYQAENLGSGTTASTRSDVAEYAVNPILEQHFQHDWTATLSGGLSADDVSSPELLTQGGAPDRYEGDRFDNRLWSAQLVASGPVVETRAGATQLAVGAGYNQQDFLFANLPGGEFTVARRRRIRFAFAETAIPLVASPPGAKDPTALSLDVAIRTERYSDVGRTTNYKIALTYQPTSSVKVQASGGTSFRAPSLLQQYDTPQAVLEFVPDTASATGQALALLRFGGNPLLEPETSTDTALDLTLTPDALPGVSLEIGYFAIFYSKRIEYPTPDTGDPLSDPNIVPFVTPNPSAAYITQVLAQSQFVDLTAGQFAARDATLVIDDRNQNIARQKASGVDLLWKYGRDTAFGRLDTSLNTAYLDLQQKITAATATMPLSGTLFYPPAWRGRFGVSWSYSRYLGSLFVNYTGGSREVSSPGQQPTPAPQSIASWTTLDGQIGIIFNGGAHPGNTKLTLSAQNLLDRHPPLFSISQLGPMSINYDSTNTSPVGRFLTLQLTQRW